MVLSVALGLIAFMAFAQETQTSVDPQCCDIAKEALEDLGKIKVGMTRREVEEKYERDGGLQFPSPTVYVWPKCEYIKLRIKYKVASDSDEATGGDLLSPDDTVAEGSELLVEYRTMD